MSALAHLASRNTEKYPDLIEGGNRILQLPDGTPFAVDVIVSHAPAGQVGYDIQGGDLNADLVSLKIMRHHPSKPLSNDDDDDDDHDEEHDFLDYAKAVFELAPPCPPYPNPASEPDDNTLATRSKRFAYANLHKASHLNAAKVWSFIYAFFQLWPAQEYFSLCTLDLKPGVVAHLVDSGLATVHPLFKSADGGKLDYLLVSRAAFWQGRGLTANLAHWVLPKAAPLARSKLLSSNASLGSLPPTKPSPEDGPLYSRYIPDLQQTLTFRVVSSKNARDIDLITQWHDSDRVNEGWRQRGSREDQLKDVQKMEANPYSLGLIGEWDGEPWGYVEVYYAKQSNLRDQYDASIRDRGFHALVGNEKFRGPHRVRSWMGSLVHLMFLLDPQTDLCVSEPRLSNTKMVEYECMVGGHVEKFIDFPHKRAALVFFPRHRFFQLCPLQPLPEHLRSPVSK
ncbi:uncharacterized protein PFL1_00176 [Pseudozyma flocculosa PF-1]|uniref:Acyltransferase MbtK/IucB-like conserved domain-containing protein n=1 Tax=Pseudozyma flocculosa TaxID=84751 RepID=A0A5C3ETD3_9BASI|nr:uncharacterized protein PFL1_00176 [Pseudozyma flocculosa PF-1]EPQ31978.1 hypothetical protein PFL1_00176 [Pseudozyma flocculosa PF-1]SPO35100.1 uncharacterized protein PSFLO_00571 [Pseudozyma flocculosa]